MKAKNLSLISKILAVIFAIVAFIFFDKTAGEIVTVAGFIAASFVTVDISMITKNVKEKKL